MIMEQQSYTVVLGNTKFHNVLLSIQTTKKDKTLDKYLMTFIELDVFFTLGHRHRPLINTKGMF